MAADIGEKTQRAGRAPESSTRLTKLLEKYVADGRSTPGAPQQNDAKIDIWKKHLDRPGPPKPKKDIGD